MECLKQKGQQWSVRLHEEIRTNTDGVFITLTFNNDAIKELSHEIENLDGYQLDNQIATLAVRRFLERWRKKYGQSIKHWLVTELGHKGTENIHLHGLLFTKNKEDISELWKYGYVYIGDYVNEKTINYIIKYISKTDIKHKYYSPKILTSKGIGSNYFNRLDSQRNKFKGKDTKEYYTTRSGHKINLPIYYRNKIYDEDEREKLWINRLDANIRYIKGIKIDVSKTEIQYFSMLKHFQYVNNKLGYGDDKKDWKKINYERNLRNLKRLERIRKSENNN